MVRSPHWPAIRSAPRQSLSWRPLCALLLVVEAAELLLIVLLPRLFGLAVLSWLMPYTAYLFLSDGGLRHRLLLWPARMERGRLTGRPAASPPPRPPRGTILQMRPRRDLARGKQAS